MNSTDTSSPTSSTYENTSSPSASTSVPEPSPSTTITQTTLNSTDTSSPTSSTYESTSSPSASTSVPEPSPSTTITQTTLNSTINSSLPSSTFKSTSGPSASTSVSEPSLSTTITQTTLISTSPIVQSTSSTSTKVSQSPSSTTSQSTTVSTSPIVQSTSSTSIIVSQSPSSTTYQSTTIYSTSTLTIGDITSPFWVRTVCNITILTNITATQFKSDIESKLSNAYAIAYNSIQTNGRLKRAATNGTNILQLVNVARITDGQVPTNLVYYIVTSDKSFVAPSTVISNMNQLSPQQMSIYLGLPVTTVATYYNSATQNPSIDEKVWIIGAVFGSLGTIALIIWLVLFVYSRCIKPWDEPLVLKSSLDDKDSRDYVGSSNFINLNKPTRLPMVGTIDTKHSLNSLTEYKSDIILKENDKENKHVVKDEIILNSKNKDNEIVNEIVKKTEKKKKHKSYKNDNENMERKNSHIDRPINEIVIKHVFGENRRKHRKKHSSTSSSDSDISIRRKSKKKTKSKKIKIKDYSKKEKDKDNYNEKPKEKRLSDDIREKTADISMVFQTNDEISEEINYGEAFVQEKGAAFRQINKKELTNVEGDYVSENDHFQSDKPTGKLNTNLIEVQPTAISTEDISKYEPLEPTSMFNNYDHLRMFPSYSNEIYLVPDTSLNLLTLNTSNTLEDERLEMKQLNSNKKNLRTLNPLPREFTRKS